MTKWTKYQIERARENANKLFGLAQRMKSLPSSSSEARSVVVPGIVEGARSLARDLADTNISEDEAAAAIMLGRGVLFSEVADALGVDEIQVHEWRSNKYFRALVRYWREVTEDEQFGLALDELEQLVATTDDPKVLARLIDLRFKLADKPYQREKDDKDYDLKERAVLAREQEVSAAPRREFALPSVSVIDEGIIDGEVAEEDDEDTETDEEAPQL